jgi:hypothetical protein
MVEAHGTDGLINRRNKMNTRPTIVTDEHLEYLDNLRESGVTNMFGAATYVAAKFDLDPTSSRRILKYWMESFGKEDR